MFGTLLIDWVTLDEASPGAGKTIGELEIRRSTGVTIAAVVRDNQAITVPEPSEALRAGDRLIIGPAPGQRPVPQAGGGLS